MPANGGPPSARETSAAYTRPSDGISANSPRDREDDSSTSTTYYREHNSDHRNNNSDNNNDDDGGGGDGGDDSGVGDGDRRVSRSSRNISHAKLTN